MNQQTIHVAYALDDNYTEITCVSMASLLHNTKNPVHFHVVESRLSDENKGVLSGLKIRFPHGKWTFHTMGALDEQIFNVDLMHFTYEVFYRLFLPELFTDCDKMIYLDGDTVVDDDIANLWNIELDDCFLAAVPNVQRDWKSSKSILGMDEDDLYFNAGILLLNMKKLRKFELLKQAKTIIPQQKKACSDNGIIWWQDQDVLNYLFYKKYVPLPIKYNFKDLGGQPERGSLEDWREALIRPTIIHYVSDRKPDRISKVAMPHPMWERYYVYKAMTPFVDVERDNERIRKYKQHEADMDDALILNPFSFIEYKRHTLFEKLAESLPDMLQSKKLALWGVGVDTGYIIAMLSTKDIYADIVVDGLEKNHGKSLFHYTVENPEILRNDADECFVLLCMRDEKPAGAVRKVLDGYGYDKSTHYHVFEPLWDVINNI